MRSPKATSVKTDNLLKLSTRFLKRSFSAGTKFLLTGSFLILFIGFGSSPCAGQSPITGDWVGGYEIRQNYTPIKMRLSLEGAEVKGTVDFPVRGIAGVALAQGRFLSPKLHVEWPTRTGPRVLDGQLSGDSITGDLQYGSERGTFHLVRSISVDTKTFAQYVGEFEVGRDAYVSIWQPPPDEPSPGLAYTVHDLTSPDHRSGYLFPVSETAFVAGPGRWVPYPIEINATFVKNKEGEITALKWQPTGSRELIGRKIKPHFCDEEEVKFSNGDVTIAGTLSVPLNKGPHPAVIIISGSDGGGRWKGGLPTFFAQHGIAALTYDKRGFGASTGTIIGATVQDMAGDVAAGVRYLQKRPDINANKVGVWAISQGGWMAPVVAATTPNVAFMILHAGPAVSPRLQSRQELVYTWPRYGYSAEQIKEGIEYQSLYFDAMNSDEAYDKVLAAYNKARERGVPWVWNPGTKEQLRAQWTRPNLDFDPVPFLERVKCPVLAFFGEKDVLVPPDGNVSIMEAALKKSGNKDVTIKVLPGVNHNFQLPGMGTYGYQSSGKTPPGYYEVMMAWLKKELGPR